MAKQEKIPQLRFPSYTDAWEQRQLGEVADRVVRKNTKLESTLPLTISAEYGLVDQVTYFDKQIASRDVSGYYLVKNGEFAYNKSYSNGYPWGAVKRLDNYEMGVLSTLYIVFSLKDCVSSEFIKTYYETSLWHKEVSKRATEGARNHGLLNISAEDFFDTNFSLPAPSEQARIGSFFRQLDDLLTLHQRKLEETKALKKSLLQKMFPKKGEKIPEFRLPGFEGEWEEKKLDDVYQNISNAFVGTATPYYVEDGHFYLESNNIKDGQINYNNKVFINDEFYEKQKDKWLQTGDMVMVQSGHVGHTAVIPEELNNTAAHALIMFRKPKFDIEPYFLNFQYQTHKLRKKIDTITTGNTIRHILASDMKRFVVDITSYDEQIAIGNFFKRLDDLIMLHDKKLRDLRLLKKALLQQMFI